MTPEKSGWEPILMRGSESLSVYERGMLANLASNWSRCAVGERLGFPDTAFSGEIADAVTEDWPELETLANNFSLLVRLGEYGKALKECRQMRDPEFDGAFDSIREKIACSPG